jgi:hypothetical protein
MNKQNALKVGMLIFIAMINLVALTKWLLPLLFENFGNGFYDSFSFISSLCGYNPNETVFKILNSNHYDGFLYVIFLGLGIFVSWLAFFAIYRFVFFDIPLFLVRICLGLFNGFYINKKDRKNEKKDVADKHKFNPVLYFLMKVGVWVLLFVIMISSGIFIWNIISKAVLNAGYFIDSPINNFLFRATFFGMMYAVFLEFISPFLLWLDDSCQKYKYGSVDAEMYENNQTNIEEVENNDEGESKFQSAQHEYWTQWKKYYKSDLTYEKWKERINATIVFKDANHDL